MIDMLFLRGAIIIMLIVILADFLKRKYNVDLDNFDYEEFKKWFQEGLKSGFKPMQSKTNTKTVESPNVIRKSTGTKSLTLVDTGVNKATVMATLRQITGLDYMAAKSIVDSVPIVFMTDVSDKEADLTKKALEFVGAKVEIK